MRQKLNTFLSNWKIPILFWLTSTLLFILSEIWNKVPYGSVSFLIFVFSLIVLLISVIYQLKNKNYSLVILESILLLISLIGTLIYIYIIMDSTLEAIENN